MHRCVHAHIHAYKHGCIIFGIIATINIVELYGEFSITIFDYQRVNISRRMNIHWSTGVPGCLTWLKWPIYM